MVATQAQGSQTQSFTLDPEQNRIATFTSPSGATTINHYTDSTDSPTWTSTGTSWTRNLVGPNGDLAATVNEAGVVTLDIVNLHGGIVATAADDPTATGNSTYQESTEYGQPRDAGGAYGTYGWLGGARRSSDALGGSILMGARLYAECTGRFESVDPVAGGNSNEFNYPDDPINQRDTTGRSRFVWGDVTGTWYFNKTETNMIATYSLLAASFTMKIPNVLGAILSVIGYWVSIQASYDVAHGWCVEIKTNSTVHGYGSRKKGCV